MQHQRPSSLCLSTAAPMLNGAPAHSTPCPPSPAALGAAKQAWAADRPAADPSQRWQNRASAGRRAFPGAFRCRAVSLPGRVTIFLAPHAMRTFIVFFFFFFSFRPALSSRPGWRATVWVGVLQFPTYCTVRFISLFAFIGTAVPLSPTVPGPDTEHPRCIHSTRYRF